jgi:predicted membrane-bound spermidine synthase
MPNLRLILFLLFVASGFCSLVYQVVWLRLAFAAFGIITPVLSVVLSVFMLGLALGSWATGRAVEPLAARTKLSPAYGYGLVELGIGVGAFAVPAGFTWGERVLLGLGEASSGRYLVLSALIITLTIVGFATLMGMTFPLMMAFIHSLPQADPRSFSFLYLANVIGATAGASLTALVSIEMFGFRRTLLYAAAVNLLVAMVAFQLPGLARRMSGHSPGPESRRSSLTTTHVDGGLSPTNRLMLLFATGFTSLAMEVVWTRAFTPVMRTTIYAFGLLLSVYLLATWVGSAIYRYHALRDRVWPTQMLLGVLFIAALLPLVLNDPRWYPRHLVVLASIVPISLLLGYLTPRLIDNHAQGEPKTAGLAYALNVVGCIVGPLVAAYLLLPFLGVKWSLIVLALPYAAFFAVRMRRMAAATVYATATAGAAVLLVAVAYTSTYEDPALYRAAVVRRDHTATVVSDGEGMKKRLIVNGVGITHVTTITKFMAHLPLVMRAEAPKSTLVICFGMGTTFRSLATWEGRTTAVELVPSVRDAFGFYFADADSVLSRPGKQVVVDDGRRFVNRTDEQFDVITVDPPPPVEAAGSSLLYSVEFYRTLSAHLSPGGVVQQWLPEAEDAIITAVANSVRQTFPHVKVFRSIENWGYHFLASDRPLKTPSIDEAMSRMPASATRDLLEWLPGQQARELWQDMLKQEVDIRTLAPDHSRLAVTDDRPFNEYFLLRRSLERIGRSGGRALAFLERTF